MASSLVSAAGDPLVHVAFSRDGSHLVTATASGIRIFSCNPLKHVFTRSVFTSSLDDGPGPAGEVTSADLAEGSSGSLVAIVGDTIRYWSEPHGQMMGADMNLPTHGAAVRAVRHVGCHVAVAGEDRVALYEISSGGGKKQIMEVDTGPNPSGALALAQVYGGQELVLACPSPAIGEVQVWLWRHEGSSSVRVDVVSHDRSIACVELSGDGQLLATAESGGTDVRIFSTSDGLTRQELILGYVRTEVHCMAFSHDSKWLAVSSDRAAVHLFRVKVDLTPWTPPRPSDDDDDGPYLSPQTRAFMEAHLTAVWSVAMFRLDGGIRYRVAFGQEPNTIFIIGTDGNFYRCQFDQVKRNMKQIEQRNVMDMM